MSEARIDAFIDALWLEEGLSQQHAGRLPARPVALRRLAGRAGPGDRQHGGVRPQRLLRGAPCAEQGDDGQSPAHGLQALLPLGAARAPDHGRSHAAPAVGTPAAARAQDPDRGPGRGAAGRPRRGHAAGPARPHHAGTDVRQRPARERTRRAQDLQRQHERRRAARAGQRQQGAPGAVRPGGARLDHALPAGGAAGDPCGPADRRPVRHRAADTA